MCDLFFYLFFNFVKIMAKCFDVVGYVEPCNAVRQKYTGRALLINMPSAEFTLSENGFVLETILEATTFDEFYTKAKARTDVQVLPIFINAQNPFGVTVQGNTDSGRVMYTKNIPVSIPATRDSISEAFIVGLQGGEKVGYTILILESSLSNQVSDVFGAYSPIRLDPTSVTRSEYENGGAWTFNLVCEEPLPNVISDLGDIKGVLDQLNA